MTPLEVGSCLTGYFRPDCQGRGCEAGRSHCGRCYCRRRRGHSGGEGPQESPGDLKERDRGSQEGGFGPQAKI